MVECIVMRDGVMGWLCGFGFLIFKDFKMVNIVMVKEYYFDGKIVCFCFFIFFFCWLFVRDILIGDGEKRLILSVLFFVMSRKR